MVGEEHPEEQKEHSTELVEQHEQLLESYANDIKTLKEDNKILKEDNILIKDQLGVKEKKNGKRDRQLKDAWKRITEVGDKAEEEDKTLNDKVTNMQLDLAEIKGYMKGSSEKKEWSQKKTIAVTVVIMSFISTVAYGIIVCLTPL